MYRNNHMTRHLGLGTADSSPPMWGSTQYVGHAVIAQGCPTKISRASLISCRATIDSPCVDARVCSLQRLLQFSTARSDNQISACPSGENAVRSSSLALYSPLSAGTHQVSRILVHDNRRPNMAPITGHAPNLEKFLKSLKGQPIESSVESLIS